MIDKNWKQPQYLSTGEWMNNCDVSVQWNASNKKTNELPDLIYRFSAVPIKISEKCYET